ncbi:MAG: flavodoxin family protein [Bacilli bacterium]|nr:flavodoxin family protein [Bacilli bacterium]
MTKVSIIVGSRRDGNSAKLAKIMKEKFQKERIISNIITPGNQKIYLCTGCMDCDLNGKCDFKDDMEDNINKILESEALIFITPSRWNLLSGDLKIFMDRLNPLYTPKKLKDKKMISIVIGGKKKEEYSTEAALTSLNSFADSAEMKVVFQYQFNECLLANDILEKQDEIDKMINELIEKMK